MVKDFCGQKATLIGLGPRTHVALARYLVRHGAEVTISDLKPAEQLQREIALLGDLGVRLALGGHRQEDILGADIVFVTPGAPRDLECLEAARQRGIPISSETELFFALCPAPIIGITGSSGKTTTTTLVAEMLRVAGRQVFVGGNIGTPLIDRLGEIGPDSWVVLELSSFQLEPLRRSPSIAAVLNVTPNHLDRHPTMQDYIAAKANSLRFQGTSGWAVLGYDNEATRSLAEQCVGQVLFFSRHQALRSGAYLASEGVVLAYGGRRQTICPLSDIRLRGQHNWENTLAAVAIARAAGLSAEPMRQAIRSFTGVEHRLEFVRLLRGASYYNDSIATTPERTIAALRSFSEPMVLIAGGRDKHLPWEGLARLIVERLKELVLYGEAAGAIQEAVQQAATSTQPPIYRCGPLAEAVQRAAHIAAKGDVVLLSPACPSYDQFRDFEERGREFKRLVREL